MSLSIGLVNGNGKLLRVSMSSDELKACCRKLPDISVEDVAEQIVKMKKCKVPEDQLTSKIKTDGDYSGELVSYYESQF